MRTTLGQLLVNDALPSEFRNYERTLTKDEADILLAELAKKYPEKYKDISWKLMQLGRKAAYTEGTTIRLSDLMPVMDKADLIKHVRQQEVKIRNSDMSPEEKQTALEIVYGEVQKLILDQTFAAADVKGNQLGLQVKTKSRGNKSQLAALLTTPAVYQDAQGHTIPVFIGKSYAEGLDPHEYWAATYGARRGVISTKFATRQAGALGKQLGVAVYDTVVTQDDCETPYGIPVPADDEDDIGAVLARKTGKFPAGTVITKEVMAELAKTKTDEIVVRSPATCSLPAGVCKQCAGIRENGEFPEIGYHLGLNASSAIAERIAQDSLNQKHCLFSESLVLCADWSTKAIKDIVVGDMVMGCDRNGKMLPVRVKNVFDNGPRECWRTSFKRNGSHLATASILYVDSTLEHKLRAVRMVSGQKDEALNGIARMLPIGTKSKHFFAVPPSGFDDTGMINEPYALILGQLLGDGCYTSAVNGVHLSCADLQQINETNAYLARLGLKLTKLIGQDYYYRISTTDKHYRDDQGNPIKNYLIKHGMYGKYAYEKILPAVVFTWNNASVLQLLAGLFVTDGSIYISNGINKPGISLVSTSKIMLQQIQQLLMFRLGILTSEITCTGMAGADKRKHDVFALYITQLDQVLHFADIIPLIGVKRAKLVELCARYKQARKNKYGFKRISQEFLGMLPTFDIEVDHPDHMFVLANGIVVSNSGGQKDSKGETIYSGFDVVNDMAQVPENFPHRAAISEVDGTVDKIEEAPQGGWNVHIGEAVYYTPPEQPLKVKVGDKVEQGDQLSSGILNPYDIVRLKGVGEGRRYFAERFTRALRDSGYSVNRRNVEALTKSILDHVEVEEPEGLGNYLQGDVVSYNGMAYSYKPRKDAQMLAPKKAVGQYLEQPALHYTIGTRLTSKMADTLGKHGVESVMSHRNTPGFNSTMIGLSKVPEHGNDWMARLGSTYLESRLLSDIQHGSTSKIHGLNPLPGIAKGVEFGRHKGKDFAY